AGAPVGEIRRRCRGAARLKSWRAVVFSLLIHQGAAGRQKIEALRSAAKFHGPQLKKVVPSAAIPIQPEKAATPET
ncbi:MAG: hypothetical protein AAGM22_31215, partial [Acidobacteriota bacterium]